MDDAQLLKAFAQNRDEAAFAQLVDRHGPMVLGICRRLLRNSPDADDAFQATFLLLAMRAGRIREPRLVGNWLFGVATRTAMGARRSAARRIAREKRLMRFLNSKQRSETADADLRMTIDEQIHRLPDKLRQVVVCYHLQGLTTREAAEQLNWPESTVMARLKQARTLLKQRLSRKGLSVSEASMGTMLVAVVVPPLLRASAAQAGAAVIAGKITAGVTVSTKAAAMAKGTAKALFVTKMKIAAAVVVSVVTLGGAAAMTRQAPPAAIQLPAAVALKLPAEIEQALRDNENQLDPINLDWTTTYTITAARASLPKNVEVHEDQLKQPRESKFIWQRGKAFSASGIGTDRVSETSYDGRIFYLGAIVNGKPNSLSKDVNAENARREKHVRGERGSTMFNDGFLNDCGLRGVSTPTELETGRADSVVIAMLADGAMLASIDRITREQTPLVRLKIVDTDPQWAFGNLTREAVERIAFGMTKHGREVLIAHWNAAKTVPEKRDYYFDLDPAKNYAVVGREERYGDRILTITRGSDFHQLPGRTVWLPNTITQDAYVPQNSPTVILSTPFMHVESKVKELTFTPVPDQQFVIDYPGRGVMRFDRTKPYTGSGQKQYPTTANTALPKPAPGYQPLADVPAIAQPTAERNIDHRWLGMMGLGAVAVAAVWFIHRQRKSGHKI